MYVTTINTLVKNVTEFGDIPIVTQKRSACFNKGRGLHVADAADITVDYALINGKRSVYIPVVKTADASTWQVVKDLKPKAARYSKPVARRCKSYLRI